MKFGRRLLEESHPQYRHFYLAYKELKQAIKLITGSTESAAFSIQQVTHNFGNLPALAGSVFRPPESRFQDLLNHEKEKINKFMEVNLTATTAALKQLLKDLLREESTDEGYIDDLGQALADTDRQAAFLLFLKQYQSLNFIGFRKITKKYDKHNKSQSAHWYMAQLQREPFLLADFDGPLKLLSLCCQVILARTQQSFGKEALLSGSIRLVAPSAQPLPPKLCTHYFVSPDDIMRVKILLTKSIPLVSIGTCCFVGREAVEVLINPLAAIQPPAAQSKAEQLSHGYVYLDTRELDAVREILNHSRKQLAKASPNKFVTRVRWFGIHDGESDKDVYLERIRLCDVSTTFVEHQDLMAEDSHHAKDNAVMIKTKHLQSMLTNSFDIDSWIRRKGVPAEQADKTKALLASTQTALSSGELLPILQIWTHRTSFALSDENSTLIEAHLDERCTSISQLEIQNGRVILPPAPPDTVITPYTKIKSECNLIEDQFAVLTLACPAEFTFPYQLNKPKIVELDREDEEGNTHYVNHGEDLFESTLESVTIDDFQNIIQHMANVYEAQDFTAVGHAAASLFKNVKPFKLHTPSWFSSTLVAGQVDSDDEEVGNNAHAHVSGHNSGGALDYASSGKRASNMFQTGDMEFNTGNYSGQQMVGGSGSAHIELLPAPRFLDQQATGGGFLTLDAANIPIHEEEPMGLAQPLLESSAARAAMQSTSLWSRLKRRLAQYCERKAPVPAGASVRVEPKTFFANERTLLQWMNIAVLICTISITLMTFGSVASQVAGYLLAPIAVYFIIHSYHVYNRRTEALIRKEPIDYVDRRGPAVLVVSLVFAMLVIVAMNVAGAAAPPSVPPLHSPLAPS